MCTSQIPLLMYAQVYNTERVSIRYRQHVFPPPTFLLGFSQRSFVMYFLRPLSIVQIVTFPSWFRYEGPEGPPWAKKRKVGSDKLIERYKQ